MKENVRNRILLPKETLGPHGGPSPICELDGSGPHGGPSPICELDGSGPHGDPSPVYSFSCMEGTGKSGRVDALFESEKGKTANGGGQKVLQQPSSEPLKNYQQQPSVTAVQNAEGQGCDLTLSNYSIRPLEKQIFINRFGEEVTEQEKILCQIKIGDEMPKKFAIQTREVKKLTVVVGDKFSGAVLNPDIPHAAKNIENLFRSATRNIPTRRFFIDYGWQQIDGKRVYAHDDLRLPGDAEFQTGMGLPFYCWDGKKVVETFFDACSLYDDENPMSVMMPFSMLGVLYRAFSEAGHAPHFLLFINGKTGSMKTTLAKILFVQLADGMHRDTPRRIDADTVTSFERGIILSGRDTVTLIDDFAPAKSARQRADNEAKLEAIVRMVGDGSTKSRSNTNLEDCRGEGVQGVVVMTGELTGKGLSSNLRCFYCGIQRDGVNEKLVTAFQDEPYRFTTLIYNFSSFVAANWENIVGYIKSNFQQERKEVRKFLKERRMADSAVILRLVCGIIRDFLLGCGGDPARVNTAVGEMRKGIVAMAQISEDIALEETPAVRFVKVIGQLLLCKRLNIIGKRPSEDDLSCIDGFCDNDYYYFLPENLYEIVKRVFYSTNIYLPLNLDEIVKELYTEGIIVPSSNGSGKKVYYARVLVGKNKKCKFIKIKKDTLQKIVDQEGE